MFDFVSTIAAALIGSIIGSVGAVLADHWLTGRTEKSHRREILVQRYLFQLKEHRIERQLLSPYFYQYDRVSLAEAAIEHEGDSFRPRTYLEFRWRYEAENSPEKQWLAPASNAIQALPTSEMDALLTTLKTA